MLILVSNDVCTLYSDQISYVDSQRNIAVVLDTEDLTKSIKSNIAQEVTNIQRTKCKQDNKNKLMHFEDFIVLKDFIVIKSL